METWATFSINDHRRPVYRQALAFFDRIVVPLPTEPIGDQTQEELDQLKAEIDYLHKNKLAEPIEWKSGMFAEWQRSRLSELLATDINKEFFVDPSAATRECLVTLVNDPDVQAVPVYGGQRQFESSRTSLGAAEEALTIEIMQRLPVPEPDTPLENLVRLRQTPGFGKALDDLLDWKREKAPAIVLANDRGEALAAAMREFDKLTKAYAEAMESENFKKMSSVGSIFFALVTGEPLGAIKEGLVSFREMREPCWKKLTQMKCAPGGVIYHFKEATGS